jgi:hypothetical protein
MKVARTTNMFVVLDCAVFNFSLVYLVCWYLDILGEENEIVASECS